ncbi:MAG: ThuA domain-containing protein [Treponema sp.]|jgi:type 1 glutamine amidotransferase|nr:ThuA domain-containing protein [Treponema sp.]
MDHLIKILLICGDYWHPGQIPIDGIAPLSKNEFKFDIISNAKEFLPDMLKEYSVVLLCKMDEVSQDDKTPWKTEFIQNAFAGYVENGGGLVVVHSGTVAGENTEKLDRLIGCKFAGHPNASPVTVSPIKKHPITEGVEIFCEIDEHYSIDIIAGDADVLLASYSPAQGEKNKYKEDPYHNCPEAIHAAGYARTQGKGRICVLTPGHNLAVWHNPQFQKLLSNAIKWCAN